jgi:hypothetical protein
MISSALRQSFEQLTGGKAVFEHPGYGCNGPYSITHLILSKPESPLPFYCQTPGRVTYIDSLRLAARGLYNIANDLETAEKNSKGAPSPKELISALETIPPLVIAATDALRHRPQNASHPALGAAQFITDEGLSEHYYKSQATPPGAPQGDSTMSNQHHPHHHHEKAAEDAGAEKLAETGQNAGSSTSGDSTNPPADQVGSQTAAAETAPAPESVAADAPAAEPVNEIAQTAQDDGGPI